MPPKYIDVDKLISDENEAYMSAQIKLERGGKNITALINRFTHEKLLRILADAPIEDVAPVAHGKWIYDTERTAADGWTHKQYHCVICGGQMLGGLFNFCPYCGAKMDEDE